MKESLENENLLLRIPTLDDADFFYNLVTQPDFINNIGDRGVKSIDDAKILIEQRFINHFNTHGFGSFVIYHKHFKTNVGVIGLIQREFFTEPDLGYAILPHYYRKGITFEAANLVLEESDPHFPKLLAFTALHNISSQNLLRKLGFEDKGKLFIDYYGEEVQYFERIP